MSIFWFFQAPPPHWERKKKKKEHLHLVSLQNKYLKIFKPYFTTITVLVFFILIYTLIFIISCLKYIQLMYRLCYKRLTVKCVFREIIYNHGLTVKSSVCVKIIRTLLHTAVFLILSQYHIFSKIILHLLMTYKLCDFNNGICGKENILNISLVLRLIVIFVENLQKLQFCFWLRLRRGAAGEGKKKIVVIVGECSCKNKCTWYCVSVQNPQNQAVIKQKKIPSKTQQMDEYRAYFWGRPNNYGCYFCWETGAE